MPTALPPRDAEGETLREGNAMRCRKCGAQDFIKIVISLQETDTVVFVACHGCEDRWWEREGDRIPLSEVLAAAGRH
jgi:hypothetical protein